MKAGDFTEDDWLLLIEDDGPDGMGRVIGFLVFDTKAAAQRCSIGEACDLCGLYVGEVIPEFVESEILTYGDFKASYGNRTPLHNRARLPRYP